jgi:hypothetical protein
MESAPTFKSFSSLIFPIFGGSILKGDFQSYSATPLEKPSVLVFVTRALSHSLLQEPRFNFLHDFSATSQNGFVAWRSVITR